MRAEGVFRLILNVALFQGMSCERQDKWVRLIAFENGAVLHVALRVSPLSYASTRAPTDFKPAIPFSLQLGTAKGAEDLVRPPPTVLLLLIAASPTDFVPLFTPFCSSTPSSG